MQRRLAVPVGITATGQAYPDRTVTNDDLASILDTTDDWIQSRTGIRSRRWASPGTASSDLGAQAVKAALDQRGLLPDALDAIIACTFTPDMVLPCTASLIQHRLGAHHCFGYDLNAACSGFLFGLTTGASLIAAGAAKRVAVVGVDVLTSVTDMQDRNTAVLFGDGAGAAILEATEDGYGILDFEHRIDGSGAQIISMPAGGSLRPASAETVAAREHYMRLESRETYTNAVRNMTEACAVLMQRNAIGAEDVALFVPHQANLRIIEAIAKRLRFPRERIAINLGDYANTSSATVPTALHQSVQAGKCAKGDLVLLAAFGAGFTWGSVLLRWAL